MSADDILNVVKNEDGGEDTPKNSILDTVAAYDALEKTKEKNTPSIQEKWVGSAFPLAGPIVNFGKGVLQGLINTPSDIAKFTSVAARPLASAQAALAQPGSLGAQYPLSQFLGDVTKAIPRSDFASPGLAGSFGDITGAAITPVGLTEKAGLTLGKIAPGVMETVAKKFPAIAAGLETVAPSSIAAGTYAAGRDKDVPSNMLFGGAGSAAIGAAVNKLVPFMLTSQVSPINIINQAKPAVEELGTKIKQELIGGNTIAPENISSELFNRAKRVYDEFKGNIPDDINHIYVPRNQSAPALYNQAKIQGQQLGTLDNSPIKDTIQNEISKYKTHLDAMDAKDPMYSKYKSYIQELNSYLPRGEQPAQTPYGIKPDVLAKAFKEQWGEVPADLAGQQTGRRLNDFNDFDLFKRNLNNRIRGLGDEDVSLKQSLGNIKQSIHKSLDNVLKPVDTKYRDVMSLFENNRQTMNTDSPFIKLYQQTSPQSEGFLSSYLQPSKSADKATNIKNLVDMLPNEDSKKLAGAWWFKDANNVGDLVKRYNQLGTNQKNILFDPDVKKGLDALNVLSTKHPALFKESGAYIDQMAPLIGQGALGAYAALHGHPLYAAHLLAHPIGQAFMNTIPTSRLVSKFIQGGLEPSAQPMIASRILGATIPTAWSKLRGQ